MGFGIILGVAISSVVFFLKDKYLCNYSLDFNGFDIVLKSKQFTIIKRNFNKF